MPQNFTFTATGPAALAARAFLISFLDNVYHYETPIGDTFYARNLALPAAFSAGLLHFNLHGVHHRNPSIPWAGLPEAFEREEYRFHGDYFTAALAQQAPAPALNETIARITAGFKGNVFIYAKNIDTGIEFFIPGTPAHAVPLRNPLRCSQSTWGPVYLQTTSAFSSWNSQGMIMTTSPSLIQILFFILPGMRAMRVTPSMPLTLMRLEPSKLST